jgi:hypothetical protein
MKKYNLNKKSQAENYSDIYKLANFFYEVSKFSNEYQAIYKIKEVIKNININYIYAALANFRNSFEEDKYERIIVLLKKIGIRFND